jgi:flagellar basal body-associated protein FliL
MLKQPKEVIILIAVIVALMVAALIWTSTHTSRGKYKAPYKYFPGDRPNYNRQPQ